MLRFALLSLLLIPTPVLARDFTVALSPGWNPVAFRCQRLTALTAPTGTAGASWNGSNYTIAPLTLASVSQGEGARQSFFVYSTSGGNLSYSGEDDGLGNVLHLRAGWNLASFPGDGQGRLAAAAGLIYGLTGDGRYEPTSTVEAGRLYWVYSASVQTVNWVTQPAVLSWQGSWDLPVGTHRPEIVVTSAGQVLVLAVAPTAGGVKHQAFRPDGSVAFPVTAVTTEFGEPSDHRALIHGDELVVVYQSNVWRDGHPPPPGSGPAEPFTLNQSLMLARFTPDGKLIARVPIVANAVTGTGDNFPDMTIAWARDHLVVQTGTGQQRLKIREVSLDGKVLSTREYPASPQAELNNEVGNGLFVDVSGQLVLATGNPPDSTRSLALTPVTAEGSLGATTRLPSTGREENFPTGHATFGSLDVVAYISRAPGGSPTDFLANPYNPYVKVLDANRAVLADLQVGSGGELHVHPTVAVLGDRLLVAWSRHSSAGAPQVRVEEYVRGR